MSDANAGAVGEELPSISQCEGEGQPDAPTAETPEPIADDAEIVSAIRLGDVMGAGADWEPEPTETDTNVYPVSATGTPGTPPAMPTPDAEPTPAEVGNGAGAG